MLNKLIHFSIQNKLVVGVFTIILVVWGSWSATKLPIDAVPDITNNQVQIYTATPSFAAEDIERVVTFPIEVATSNIPGLIECRSFSRFGLSVITLVFTDDTDIYWARQQISERLKTVSAQLPVGIGIPELAPVSTGLSEIYQYIIKPKKGAEKKYTTRDLRTIQDWYIRRQLLGTKGVADITTYGGHRRIFEVAVDPHKIRSMNITLDEIYNALKINNQNTGGAYVDKKPEAWFIRTEGLTKNIPDINNIVLKQVNNGLPILIKDVATVREASALSYSAMTYRDEMEVVGATILMLKGENSNEVIKNIEQRMTEIKNTLPEDIEIVEYINRSRLVNRAINTVIKNLVEGALIVIFVLVLILGNFRAGIIVASVIPLAMLFALGLMNLFGVSANLMSLGAIDFGLIVDGAVIIVEGILHHLGLKNKGFSKLSQEQMDEEVFKSTSAIRGSAAFGEIIILIVYLPILALVGIEGKMFKPMAQTVIFAILGAFLLSLTYVPMMSSLFLSKSVFLKKNYSDRLLSYCQKIYKPLLLKALVNRTNVLVISLLLFLLSIFIFLNLGGEFIPTLEEGDFAVETKLLTGSSISQTVDVTLKSGEILLKQFPEIEQVVGRIGSGDIPTDPMPPEAGDLIIVLKDKDEWTSASSREELADKMQKALQEIPGVNLGFQQPIQMRFNELITGARQDVVVKIYGEDLNILSEHAEKLGKIAKQIQGAEDIWVEKIIGLKQIVIRYKRDLIAQFGLDIETINRAVRMSFAGEVAGQLYEGEKSFDIVLRFEQSNRQSLEDIQNIFIQTPAGNQIPLSQVADVSFKSGPNQIQRDNTKRRITIGFNVRGRDVESIIKELQGKVTQAIQLPVGYSITYGGQFENLQQAKSRLMIAVPVAMFLIFVLLFFTFQSIQQSVLIFTAIPLSAIGGVLALWIRGMPFSISAGIGFIALFGVAVLNGIVLIAEFNRLKHYIPELKQVVITGTEIRLRPVLMTALVASLGFLPMALSTGSGAEVQKPLATVVIGGLVSSTILTLVVLPILYLITEKPIRQTI